MDIKIQTKISVLLEKIQYLNQGIQQQGGAVSKLDKDLLTNYVRELYEMVLTMPVQTPGYPDPTYLQQNGYHQPVYPSGPQPSSPSYAPPQNQNGFFPPNASPIGNQPSVQQQQPQPEYTQNGQQPYVNGHNGQNGYYNGGQTNGATQQQEPLPHAPSGINPAFTLTNGKRTLSESIRIKTAETEKPSLNEQFKNNESRDLAANMQLTPIKDLKNYIGLNKRFSYINFLFANDANLYDEAIEKLNTSGGSETAMDYLNNHLRPKLKWSDDNEMVAEFYQLVERRYLS